MTSFYDQIRDRDEAARQEVLAGLRDVLPEGIATYLRAHGYVICRSADWRPYERQMAEANVLLRAADKAAAADRLAAALPYHGVIKYCQASAPDRGRGVGDHRCGQRARHVVQRAERSGAADGDGRLAVCAAHAKDTHSFRYRKHWDYQRSADESVEPEYQP